MGDKRPQSRIDALLLALISATFATTALIWLHLDRTPPNWDDAVYLANSLLIYDAFARGGIIAYITKVWSLFPLKAPLISILPTPFYLIFGRHWHAAYFVNIISMLLLFFVVYDLARRWWSTRAGLFAVVIAGTMPLLYGLAGWFMVEYALTALVAAAVWLLILSDRMERRAVVFLFGAVCGFGLLLKASFGMFLVFPFLYVWIQSRFRRQALSYAAIPCLILALPWYTFHLRSTAEYVSAAAYGKSAAVYGTGAVFSLHAIARYLSNVMREAISGYYVGLAVLLGGWTIWQRRIRPSECGETFPGARILLLWTLPFVAYLFGANKDVRFIAPMLPAFALLLASMLDYVSSRGLNGTTLAWVLLVYPFLQLFSASFGIPFNSAEEGYARRFHREPWRHDEILAAIWANTHVGPGEGQRILVGTDVSTLNADNVELTAIARQLPFQTGSTAHEPDLNTLLSRLEHSSFFLYKEGGEPELSAFNPYYERLVRQVRDDQQFSEVSRGWPWPDGGIVHLFKNLAIPSIPVRWAYLNSGLEQSADLEIPFGEMLSLTGLSASRLGDVLDVKYRWRCLKRPNREYKCFTHVLDSEGKVIGQLDHYVLGGEPAMRSWTPGDDAVEEMRFRIPEESSGKAIRLRIGLFDPVSGERLRIEIQPSRALPRFLMADGGTALMSDPVQ
jgi:4-amino-4-deoxy-L-arabinose transferase-like glycosyltransferase